MRKRGISAAAMIAPAPMEASIHVNSLASPLESSRASTGNNETRAAEWKKKMKILSSTALMAALLRTCLAPSLIERMNPSPGTAATRRSGGHRRMSGIISSETTAFRANTAVMP
ncbi:hypothetical protein D9M68_859300 [compost metagenome]